MIRNSDSDDKHIKAIRRAVKQRIDMAVHGRGLKSLRSSGVPNPAKKRRKKAGKI